MKEISKLLNSFTKPDTADITMSTDGYAIWFTWNGENDPSVAQILQDYGGLAIKKDTGQALWFFFNGDMLLAIAKLHIWAQFNPIVMSLEAFPATLIVDVQKNLSLQIEPALEKQTIDTPDQGLLPLIHPKLAEFGKNIPGLAFEPRVEIEELKHDRYHKIANLNWHKFSADTRLPYTSSQGWYVIIHPLGSPLDKKFQHGWRAMFIYIEEILQKLKLKYSLFETYLMVPVETLTQLRSWVREFIEVCYYTKENSPENYWPCVSSIVDKKGLNFNNELPHKIPIKWDTLTPDVPYMNYRNAYLLGEGYGIQDMYFVAGTSSIDNWCTVNLDALSQYSSQLSVLLPSKFVTGAEIGCFYCGIKSHESSQCPTKKLPAEPLTFWQDFNNVDIEEMNVAFRNIEIRLAKAGTVGYSQIIKEKASDARILEAVLNINPMLQLRSIERIWLLSGKNIFATIDDSPYVEDSPCWTYLERMQSATANELNIIEKDVHHASNRNPRDWRLKCLLGFIAIEKGDYNKALIYWKQAESHSTSVLHQAWHYFLQGRLKEMLSQYTEALELYENVRKLLPDWYDPMYRSLVCRVKMGFADQAQGDILSMVKTHPSYFNRILIDPELERGQRPVLAALSPLWTESLKQSTTEKDSLQHLIDEVNDWFDSGHKEADEIRAHLKVLMASLEVRNYLACQHTVRTRPQIEIDFNDLRDNEIEELKGKFKDFLTRIEVIRDEASWFPFPRTLIDFNKDFNECAGILNWAFSANFRTAEAFKRAQGHITPIKDLLFKLQNKLRLIRFVRDATLFLLILIKIFFWIEIISLIVAALSVMLITLSGQQLGIAWLQRLVMANFWELQKVLVGVISVTALGLAVLRTTMIFEKKREEMLENAKQYRKMLQQRRLSKIQKQKDAGYLPEEIARQAQGLPPEPR